MDYLMFRMALHNNFNVPFSRTYDIWSFIVRNYETRDIDEAGLIELIDQALIDME